MTNKALHDRSALIPGDKELNQVFSDGVVVSASSRIGDASRLNHRAWFIMAGSNEVMRILVARTVLGV